MSVQFQIQSIYRGQALVIVERVNKETADKIKRLLSARVSDRKYVIEPNVK